MKFTQEEAFEKLKGILTIDGKKTLRMSERSIKSQLETLLPLVVSDDMELDDFCNKYKSLFETMNSNAEKDSSDFVEKWKTEHPEKKEPKATDKKKEGEEKTEMQILMEEFKAIKEELNAEKAKKTISAKKNELAESLKKKGVKDAEWINAMLDEIPVTEDIDISSKTESILKLYNRTKATIDDTSKTPHSSGSGSDIKHLFDDIVEEYKQHEGDKKDVI